MQLSEIRTRLADVYGSTLNSENAFYNRVINDVYFKLCSLKDWWWLETDGVIRTTPIVETGLTASVTQDNADITTSSALDASYKYGWASSGTHVYRISNIVTTTVTLDATWIEDTDAAQAMTFWNDMFLLPADCKDILEMTIRYYPNDKPLARVEPVEIERHGLDLSAMGGEWGQMYALIRDTALSETQLFARIFPPPTVELEYSIRYMAQPTALSADADVPLVPVEHHDALVELAIVRALEIDQRPTDHIQHWQGEARFSLRKMLRAQDERQGSLQQVGMKGSQEPENVHKIRIVNVS
jgi:hypothetical protein